MKLIIRVKNWFLNIYEFAKIAGFLKTLTIILLLICAVLRVAQQFDKSLFQSIVDSPVYQGFVLLALTEILVLIINQNNPIISLSTLDERAMDEKIRELCKKNNISDIFVSTIDLGCRKDLLSELANNNNINFHIYHGNFQPDSSEQQALMSNLDYLRRHLTDENKYHTKFEFIPQNNQVMLRAFILRSIALDEYYGFIGWYTYHGIDLQSNINPSIFVTNKEKKGTLLLKWAASRIGFQY